MIKENQQNIFKTLLAEKDNTFLTDLGRRLHCIGKENRYYHGPLPNMGINQNRIRPLDTHFFYEHQTISEDEFIQLKEIIERVNMYIGPLPHEKSKNAFDVDPNKMFGVYESGHSYKIDDEMIDLTALKDLLPALAEYEDIFIPARVTKKNKFTVSQRLIIGCCDLQLTEEMMTWFVNRAESQENVVLAKDAKRHAEFITVLHAERKAKIQWPPKVNVNDLLRGGQTIREEEKEVE